jgi:hypothetical protein
MHEASVFIWSSTDALSISRSWRLAAAEADPEGEETTITDGEAADADEDEDDEDEDDDDDEDEDGDEDDDEDEDEAEAEAAAASCTPLASLMWSHSFLRAPKTEMPSSFSSLSSPTASSAAPVSWRASTTSATTFATAGGEMWAFTKLTTSSGCINELSSEWDPSRERFWPCEAAPTDPTESMRAPTPQRSPAVTL